MTVTVPDISPPYIYDLAIRRGDSFSIDFTFLNKDYTTTTHVILSEVRDIYSRMLIATFTLTANINIVTIALTAAQTSALRPGTYEYDVVVYYDDTATTRVKGSFKIEGNTTENT